MQEVIHYGGFSCPLSLARAEDKSSACSTQANKKASITQNSLVVSRALVTLKHCNSP